MLNKFKNIILIQVGSKVYKKISLMHKDSTSDST